MTDDPVELDARRGMNAQQATKIRRENLQRFRADQAALRQRQEELENFMAAAAAPAETWLEAAAKAQYLLDLFAKTSEAQDPRRQQLIADTLDDLARLSEREVDPS